MEYPIGIQSFPALREDGCIYVDKTDLIYNLTHKFRGVFLSRPRRFGKSLLLSTIEAYFKGRQDLFKGLAIDNLEKDWHTYPVIHVDFNNGDFNSVNDLKATLKGFLLQLETQFGLQTRFEDQLGLRFEEIIKEIATAFQQRVVILIDEYDQPLQKVITNELLQKEYREVLKPFFGTLKKTEEHIKFICITGVTKFAKLSIFSDLNQLKDISLLPDFDTLCGITTQEMLNYFPEGLKEFAEDLGNSVDEIVKKLEQQYDGYHFSKKLRGVFNPFSLLNALSDREFEDYWFQTGTPTFLVELLKTHHTNIDSLAGAKADASFLKSVESITTNPLPVIFQSGYLTIKDFDPVSGDFTLDYPNDEVRRSCFNETASSSRATN